MTPEEWAEKRRAEAEAEELERFRETVSVNTAAMAATIRDGINALSGAITAATESVCGFVENFVDYFRNRWAWRRDGVEIGVYNILHEHAAPKEWHYIRHGRKARTRKKYRNRVINRWAKEEQKARSEQ